MLLARDASLKKANAELEERRRAQAGGTADVGRMRAQLGKLAEEVDELKGENDFLNGEVARYVQKNKELTAKLASLKES